MRLRTLPFAAAALLAAAPAATAQTGLLVVAHGAGPEWNGRVREVVAQVRWPAGPVAAAFLMGPEATTAGWDAGVDSLLARGVRQIVVVPLMVSSAGSHYRQIHYYAGALAELPPELAGHDHGAGRHRTPPVPTRVTGALDGAPELALAMADLWRGLDSSDRRRPLLLVAHGPTTDREAEQWIADLTRALAPVVEPTGIRFGIGLLRDDAAPPVRAAAIARLRESVTALAAGGDSVTVLPVLISQSAIGTRTIPRDLADLPIRYHARALAPSPRLARWIERIALATLAGTD